MSETARAATGQTANTFGERLRHLREAAGLTQEALAAAAGLSVNAIGALERGDRRHPYPSTIQVLASVLGLGDKAREELVALIPRRGGRVANGTPEAGALPVPANELLGRENLVDDVVSYLRGSVRLLTMTGPGGVGKTRLALRVAAELQDELADGARLVPLVQVADPHLVPAAIARGLGLRASGRADGRDVLLAWLRQRDMLLVIDNFEQVADAAPLVGDLLATCPGLRIIVTSRISLRLDGEQEFPVPPLPLPGDLDGRPLAELADEPAVDLFLRRARAVRPDVVLTAENAPAIVEICRRLDGLPLAIELAAARSKLLSPQAMVEHLDSRLHLLVGGGADRPSRLQTMRDAIAWSYALLDPSEQRLLRRLSVFAGGCMLDAAGAVASDGDPADPGSIAGIATLIDHSLLLRDELPGGDVRVRLLEVIREYGAEQLEACEEVTRTRDAHAAWYLRVAGTAREQIEGPRRRAAHRAIRRDLDNLRAAIGWLVECGDADRAYRLATEMARFWIDLGHIAEGRRWLGRVIAMSGTVDPAARAEALYWAAGFANLQDDRERAIALAGQSLALARQHGNARLAAMALTQRAGALAAASPELARPLVEEARAIFHAEGDAIQEGIALRQLGLLAHARGAYDEASRRHADALVIWRRLDHPWGIPSALRDQAGEALAQHDAPLAWALYRESIVRWRDLGERMHISDCLSGLARAALDLGKPETAAMLLGAQEALNASMGYVPPQSSQADLVGAVSAVLGLDDFDVIRAEGAARPLGSVIDEILAAPVEQPKG
jgi:predicted ATPase/transcriptional regulator with XRE-family HTH domain